MLAEREANRRTEEVRTEEQNNRATEQQNNETFCVSLAEGEFLAEVADEVAILAGEMDEFEAAAKAFAMAEQGSDAERFEAVGQREFEKSASADRHIGGEQQTHAFLVEIIGTAMDGGLSVGRDANAEVNPVAWNLTTG
jgi:hypothetical protein